MHLNEGSQTTNHLVKKPCTTTEENVVCYKVCNKVVRPRQEGLIFDLCKHRQHRTCNSGIDRTCYRRAVKEICKYYLNKINVNRPLLWMGRLCFWAVFVWAVFAYGPFWDGPFLFGTWFLGRFPMKAP